MAKRKATAKELEPRAEPNPTAIGRGLTERKIALETTGSIIRRLRGIKIRVLNRYVL